MTEQDEMPTVHELRQARARFREEPAILDDELDTRDPDSLSIEDLRALRKQGEAL